MKVCNYERPEDAPVREDASMRIVREGCAALPKHVHDGNASMPQCKTASTIAVVLVSWRRQVTQANIWFPVGSSISDVQFRRPLQSLALDREQYSIVIGRTANRIESGFDSHQNVGRTRAGPERMGMPGSTSYCRVRRMRTLVMRAGSCAAVGSCSFAP